MSLSVPEACTLPTAEQPLRLAEFDELFATAVRGVETPDPTHARMRLTGPAGLAAQVRDLTARETQCCSFFTFTLTTEPAVDGEAMVLAIEVPAAHAEVLNSLAQRAPVTAYHFPSDAGAGEAALQCDLAADGGDAHDRIEVWQQVLTRAQRRDPLPDPDNPTQTGVVLRFPFDVDLAATLGRLAAAEYRCCSFGSYTIVIDSSGLRLELRMPIEAADTIAAVIGLPRPAA